MYFCNFDADMRVTTILIYFCFLLLGGKDYASASIVSNNANSCSIKTVSENKQSMFSNDDQSTIVIEDVDLDTDEEFSADTSLKNTDTFLTPNSLVTTLYSADISFSLLDYNKKSFKTFPHLRGNSCPIYIVQRVIRI